MPWFVAGTPACSQETAWFLGMVDIYIINHQVPLLCAGTDHETQIKLQILTLPKDLVYFASLPLSQTNGLCHSGAFTFF